MSAEGLTLAADDLLRLTGEAELVVELEPATGSRLKGSYWVASLPALGVTASALGLEETLERLAIEAVGAARETVDGDAPDRGERLAVAFRVIALDRLGRLVDQLRAGETVAESFLEMVEPPDRAA